MVSVLSANVATRPAEQRVLLCDISWQSYEQILTALGEHRSARLIYFDGYLEIMTPLEEHEGSSSRIDQFINVVTEETGQCEVLSPAKLPS